MASHHRLGCGQGMAGRHASSLNHTPCLDQHDAAAFPASQCPAGAAQSLGEPQHLADDCTSQGTGRHSTSSAPACTSQLLYAQAYVAVPAAYAYSLMQRNRTQHKS